MWLLLQQQQVSWIHRNACSLAHRCPTAQMSQSTTKSCRVQNGQLLHTCCDSNSSQKHQVMRRVLRRSVKKKRQKRRSKQMLYTSGYANRVIRCMCHWYYFTTCVIYLQSLSHTNNTCCLLLKAVPCMQRQVEYQGSSSVPEMIYDCNKENPGPGRNQKVTQSVTALYIAYVSH